MRRTLKVKALEPVLSQISGIPYKIVPHWYGTTARPLYLDLILPKLPERRHALPVLVWLCGGAFAVMDRCVWLPTLMDYARVGYAVASVDYRTAPQDPYPAAVEDVRAAIRWLRAHADQFGLDPDRIAAMGESAGGYLALMTALGGGGFDTGEHLDFAGPVQAVVDYYGVADFALRGSDEGCNHQVVDQFLGGDLSRKRLERLACRNLIRPDSPPMLILHGSADPLVPVEGSIALYEALQAAGVPSDLILLDGAGHGEDAFYQPEIRSLILSFLQDCLGTGSVQRRRRSW